MRAGNWGESLTRAQFLKGAGAAGALLAAGGWRAAGAQEAPENVVLTRPIRGRLLPGRTAHYLFDYPGDESVYTVEMQVTPDSAVARAGFRVYAPDGRTQVIGGAQGGLQPNVAGNVIATLRGRYLLQAYNDNPGLPVDYWVRVLAGRPEGQVAPSVPSIAESAAAPLIAYVGCYTGPGGGSTLPMAQQGHGQGIKVYRMDPNTGGLSEIQLLKTLDNPSFLAIDPTQRILVAIHGSNTSQVSSYAIDPASGTLTFLSSQSSNGTNPVYPVISADSRWVLIANYTGSTIAAYPLGPDGRLGEATHVVTHTGPPGPLPAQNAPHPHQITWDTDGRFVLVPDLGLDKVFVYKFDGSTGKFSPNDFPFLVLPAGSGPRHLAFHPSGSYVYVINEHKSTLTACAYDREKGALLPLQTVSSLPSDFSGASTCAEVVVHPSGQFVYGSNRGHESIVSYAIDQATGMLSPIEWTPIDGKTPRHFNLDPTGSYLYAEGFDSDSIKIFSVDGATGRLTPTGQMIETGSPVCLIFGKV
jgi:6-phosphogluconolactonase (cycloisomerase 2 family)